MTDPEYRAINRAIVLLTDEYQMEREQARAALHELFRREQWLRKKLAEADRTGTFRYYHKEVSH